MASYPFPADLQVSINTRFYENDLVVKDAWEEVKFREKLRADIAKKLEYLENKYDPFKDKNRDIYIGSGGIAMMYFHLANTYASDDITLCDSYLEKSIAIIEDSIKVMKQNKIAFLHGPVGLYSIGAVAHLKLKHQAESEKCLKLLVDQFNLFKKKPFPSELLYGQAGYLHALLFVHHYIADALPEGLIRDVVALIIAAGKVSSTSIKDNPLSYTWHCKHYIGGAHGMAGIACQLLQVESDVMYEFRHELVPMINYLVSLQKKSGNFPSSLESIFKDQLVQFCHGAPGVIPMMALAKSQKLGIDGLVKACDNAVNVTWSQGLLTKGHGLCHGVSGNAYAFLSMYRHTHNIKYLRQAMMFAEWIVDRGDTEGDPDNYFSLFEGLPGNIYFLADMLNPNKSAFPCFELPPL